MSESFRALCTDFYVNQKLQVKMELPRTRENILDMFERVRKQFPGMTNFRKFRDELALESAQSEMPHRWMAVRGTTIRSGVVNAETSADAYSLHKHILETAPTFLSISPLDLECVELLFGFDMVASGNHDAIVIDALIPQSPLATLLEGIPDAKPSDFQPAIGMSLGKHKDIEIYFEVKTRPADHRKIEYDGGGEPISVYVTMRKFGPIMDTKELPAIFSRLARLGEELIEHKVVPGLLVPIREAISSGNA
jgi:hypothetical protein